MAHFNNLPVELISIIAQNLKRTRDLNNFAKVNRKSYEVANPILYRTPAGGSNRGWPLKWAAHQGHVGTLLKALAGGYDPNLELFGPALRPRGDLILRNFGGLKLPSWDPEKEWEPKEGDGEETTHTNPPSHLRIVTNAWDSPNAFDGFGSSDGSDGSDDSELSIGGDWDALEGGDSDESEDPADDLLFGMDYPDYEEFFDDGHAGDGAGEDAYSALHIAAMYGHKDIIHILLEHGAAIDKPTSFLCGCRRAFSHRHLNIFGENELYSAGVWTALHLAICHSQPEMAKFLLSKGATVAVEPSTPDSMVTALHHAAAFGLTDLVTFLLDNEYVKDVDRYDDGGLTPLYYAYASGCWDSTLPLLLERGANINFKIGASGVPRYNLRQISTTLFEACNYGYYDEAVKLIDLGADVEQGLYRSGHELFTPLHAACRPPEASPANAGMVQVKLPYRRKMADRLGSARQRLLEKLISKGASLDARSYEQCSTALHFAAGYRIAPAVKSLLAAGANFKLRDLNGYTPMIEACRPRAHSLSRHDLAFDPLDIITTFLKFGSDINDVDSETKNPALHLVCQFTTGPSFLRERIARLLLNRGANQYARNNEGQTAFQVAFKSRSLSLCDILLRRGEQPVPLTRDELHQMAGLLASGHFEERGDSHALELLLDIDVKGYLHSEPTTLKRLVHGQVRLAEQFLDKAIPSMSDKQYIKILEESLSQGSLCVAKKLVAGMPPKLLDEHAGELLLRVTTSSVFDVNLRDLMEHILETGIDIHSSIGNSLGISPLQSAIEYDNVYAIAVMLEKHPLRNDPRVPKGVYLHAAVHAYHEHRHPRKKTLSLLIRSGADPTEVDENDDTPLSLFLRSLSRRPSWVNRSGHIAGFLRSRIWYLWKKDLDVNRKNKEGKSIVDYLHDLKSYEEPYTVQHNVAREIQQHIKIEDDENGRKRIKFLKPLLLAANPKSPSIGSLQDLLMREHGEEDLSDD